MAGVDKHQRVPVVGRSDDYGVDVLVFEKLFIIFVACGISARFLRRQIQIIVSEIADGDGRGVAEFEECFVDLITPVAEADIAHTNALVCAEDTAIARGRQRRRGAYEVPACDIIHNAETLSLYIERKMRCTLAFVFVLGVAGMTANGKVLVHGHRGARAVLPENTLPAFEYAIGQGVDVLELDMAVTKDNVLVVSHDPLLSSPVCTGPRDHVAIHSLTLAEVREYDCGAKAESEFPKAEAGTGYENADAR